MVCEEGGCWEDKEDVACDYLLLGTLIIAVRCWFEAEFFQRIWYGGLLDIGRLTCELR